MYAYIAGEVVQKAAAHAVIDVGGGLPDIYGTRFPELDQNGRESKAVYLS